MSERAPRERLASVRRERTVRLTTFGRKTGRPHGVTIWFLVDDDGELYLNTLRLDRDWPRNLLANGKAELVIGGETFGGRVARVEDVERAARVKGLLRSKYLPARLASWIGIEPVAIFHVDVDV